jgi:hypothetical protein
MRLRLANRIAAGHIRQQEGTGMKKRLISGVIGGALLGLICVAGAMIRSDLSASPAVIFPLWYNG